MTVSYIMLIACLMIKMVSCPIIEATTLVCRTLTSHDDE